MDDQRREQALARRYKLAVCAVVIATLLTRFVGLDRYPTPIHQDELSNIYDGYSLAMTGADRDGVRWPFIIRAMGPGDYRPALYSYLAAVTTGMCGFSTWAGRLPAAILGTLTVILVFLVARRLAGRSGGLLGMLFAAFCPILIQYGRQAHEGACLPPFFAILIVYLLYRATGPPAGDAKPRAYLYWAAAAGLAVGLSASAYGTQRMTAPLFAVLGGVLILWEVGWRQRAGRRAGVALLVFALAAAVAVLPQVYAMVEQPGQFFARAKTVSYNWRAGPIWWGKRILDGYATHFDPRLLAATRGQYADLVVARMSPVALPFLYIGLMVALCRVGRDRFRTRSNLVFLLLAILIAVLPAVCTKRHSGILRASGVWSLYPVICALGVISLDRIARTFQLWPARGWIRQTRRRWREEGPRGGVVMTFAGIVVVAAGLWNIGEYLVRPEWRDPRWFGSNAYHARLVQIGQWLQGRDDDYQRIYVDAPEFFAYLYVAAFSGMPPEEYQRAPRRGSISWDGWEELDRLGRFRFADLSAARAEWAASARTGSWLYVSTDGQTVVFDPGGVEQCAGLVLGPTEFEAAWP